MNGNEKQTRTWKYRGQAMKNLSNLIFASALIFTAGMAQAEQNTSAAELRTSLEQARNQKEQALRTIAHEKHLTSKVSRTETGTLYVYQNLTNYPPVKQSPAVLTASSMEPVNSQQAKSVRTCKVNLSGQKPELSCS